jgi:hypothetical protein
MHIELKEKFDELNSQLDRVSKISKHELKKHMPFSTPWAREYEGTGRRQG